jgi:hypothetical protein
MGSSPSTAEAKEAEGGEEDNPTPNPPSDFTFP